MLTHNMLSKQDMSASVLTSTLSFIEANDLKQLDGRH